ncbi:hypothetical protein AB205_0189010, partial [Aquarana catesbeiana]
KTFAKKESLVKHEKPHTGKHSYSCTECGKSFVCKGDLVKHQKIHTGERLYSCSECRKSFNKKDYLVKHKKFHMEFGKSFIRKGDLLKHQKLHTNDRLYSCTECRKSFIHEGDLVKHQRIHKVECPYSCPECRKSFTEKKLLLTHQRRHMDHMMSSMRTEENPSHMTERILDLTLEIIYLLTGESFPPVKYGDHLTIRVPSPHSLKLKRNKRKKILEVTQKIIDLLTGEEWEYLEGHKDLYKDVMMENQPPLTSPDGSSNGNPPERCPRPLYSRDSSMEKHTSLHKGINQCDWKHIKEEIKEEEDEVGVMEKFLEGQKYPFKNVMMDPSGDTNPQERCPRPLYSPYSTQEDHTIPHHQGEERINIKAEVKEEEVETDMGGDQPSMEEVGMIMKSEEDEISLPINTNGCDVRNTSKRHLLLSADQNSEDGSITQDPPGENPNTQNIHHRPSCPETSMDPSDQGESSHQSHTMIANICFSFHTADRSTDPSNPKEPSVPQEGVYRGDNLFSYLVCGKCFAENKNLLRHQRIYTSKRSYSCSECGKCLTDKGKLLVHRRYHMVESPDEERINIKVEVKKEKVEPYVGGDQPSTEEVGMVIKSEQDEISLPINTGGCDVRNSSERHLLLSADCKSEDNVITQDPPGGNPNTQNIHHRPSCPETSMDPSDQGESSHQSHTMIVNIHVRSHTADRSTDPSNPEESSSPHEGDHRDENLFSCSECGKCFTDKGQLLVHHRSHTGERPYACIECGKCFSQKGDFVKHEMIHTGERPYSCTECGKGFSQKGDFVRHQKIHMGERPYSCSDCGKFFTKKDHLVRHQRIHTGERPYSCSECGKSFTK